MQQEKGIYRSITETLLPWQTFSSASWVGCGLFCGRSIIGCGFLHLLLALLLARSFGMCWNRFVDRELDSKNPRTATRALPSGQLSAREMFFYSAALLTAFLYVSYFFPFVGRALALLVASAIAIYPFLKRVTLLCHLFLGSIYALLPIAGVLWQSGEVALPALLLGIAAGSAVCSADIIYALSDIKSDRELGLYSIPSRYGASRAYKIALLFYLFAMGSATIAFILLKVVPFLLLLWGVVAIAVVKKSFPLLLLFLPLSSLTLLLLNWLWTVSL